jgi:cell division protein FtsW (lipid II flippase)
VTAPVAPAPPPAPGNSVTGSLRAATSGFQIATRRNVELALLLFVMVLLLGYAAAVEAAVIEKITGDFWVQTATLGALFFAAHLAVRFLAPNADPVLLPAVAFINGLGVLFLRRIDYAYLTQSKVALRADYSPWAGLGGRQLLWTVIALVFAGVILAVVRDHKSMSKYAYTLGLLGIVLVLIPALLPASYAQREGQSNGAKLWIRVGSYSIQPGEFAKIMLLVFFAYYLVKKREVLSLASRRFLGIDFPRGRDLGPVITVWVLSLMILVFVKDLGTSLMYFGMFVVTVYIATERASWLIIGFGLFIGGAFLAYFLGASVGGPFANFYTRAEIWLDPFEDPQGDGYQLVQSLLGLGTGGLFGSGPGGGSPRFIPEVQNDLIFSGLGEEIGLFGLTAILMVYLLIVERGLRTALGVRDAFGKLFAGGMSFTLGLQVFVIVGGVTRLIPLTGQTTPFMSAGGSSLMANWILIFLLLRISDAARNPASSSVSARPGVGRNPPEQLHDAPTEMIR